MTVANPKDVAGSDKLPLHLWPATATALGCLGMLDGALKYGRTNWRAAGIRPSIYVDACARHLLAWFSGEDDDPDSGLPHLAHALATIAIVVDAKASGRLIDDRDFAGSGYRRTVESLTPHVARLKALHAARSPKHWTIDDNGEAAGVRDIDVARDPPAPASPVPLGDRWSTDTLDPPPTRPRIVTGESARMRAKAYCRGCLLPRVDCNCHEAKEIDGRTA